MPVYVVIRFTVSFRRGCVGQGGAAYSEMSLMMGPLRPEPSSDRSGPYFHIRSIVLRHRSRSDTYTKDMLARR